MEKRSMEHPWKIPPPKKNAFEILKKSASEVKRMFPIGTWQLFTAAHASENVGFALPNDKR